MKIKSLVVSAVLVAAVLCSSSFVKGQTVDIAAQIAQLTAQISQLNAKLQSLQALQAQQAQQDITTTTVAPVTPTTVAPWCHTFNFDLGYVNSGSSEVGQLHMALQKENISFSPDRGNIYAAGTRDGILRFQGKYHIPVSGFFGAQTRAKINSIYGCSTLTTPSVTPVVCVPNWQCTWGPCVNGYQSQISADSNKCGMPQTGMIACTTAAQACNSSTVQPSITVVSPNGGETITAGTTYTIKWDSRGVNNVYIKLRKGSDTYQGSEGSIAGTIPNTGSYVWIVPSTLPSGTDYSIKVVDSTTVASDISNGYFSIVAPIAQPSITVTSPNGGETYLSSQQISITWTTVNAPSGVRLISLNNIDTNTVVNLYRVGNSQTDIGNTSGSYVFTPNNVSGFIQGRYKISTYVLFGGSGADTYDSSDSYFTITAPVSLNLGVCMLRGDSTSVPSLSAADVGSGYAKISKPGSTLSDLTAACSTSVYNNLLVNYCSQNPGGSAQQQVVIYDSNGNFQQLGCGPDPLNCVSQNCPLDTPITGSLGTPILDPSATPISRYVISSSTSVGSSQATYNFTSNGGPSTITELKFSVNNPGTVSNICIGTICAKPANGMANLVGLRIALPADGTKISQVIKISYEPVSIGGVPSGTTSQIVLTSVKAAGVATPLIVNIPTPMMTLVGSMPAISVRSTQSNTLMTGMENQIGEATVTASSQGNVKVNTITFSIANQGFTGSPITAPRLAKDFITVSDSLCILSGNNVVCTLGNGFTSDYVISAGQSETFKLYAQVAVVPPSSSMLAISTSLAPAGFIWDDTSTNGASGVSLNGNLIYGFPPNSYSIVKSPLGQASNVPNNSTASLSSAVLQLLQSMFGK